MPILQWTVSLTSPTHPKGWAGGVGVFLQRSLHSSWCSSQKRTEAWRWSRWGGRAMPQTHGKQEGCSYFVPTRSSRKLRLQLTCSLQASPLLPKAIWPRAGGRAGGDSAFLKGSANSAVPAVSTKPGNAVASLIELQHKVCQSFKLRWAEPFAACESGGCRGTGEAWALWPAAAGAWWDVPK